MKVGFVCGAFDLLHTGHVHLLKECANKCDFLIVGLHLDPSLGRKDKNRPLETILERQIKLSGCKYVQDIVVYEKEKDLIVIKDFFQIDVRFLGSDYKNTDKPVTDMGIPIEYIDSIDIHTSDIRKRI